MTEKSTDELIDEVSHFLMTHEDPKLKAMGARIGIQRRRQEDDAKVIVTDFTQKLIGLFTELALRAKTEDFDELLNCMATVCPNCPKICLPCEYEILEQPDCKSDTHSIEP